MLSLPTLKVLLECNSNHWANINCLHHLKSWNLKICGLDFWSFYVALCIDLDVAKVTTLLLSFDFECTVLDLRHRSFHSLLKWHILLKTLQFLDLKLPVEFQFSLVTVLYVHGIRKSFNNFQRSLYCVDYSDEMLLCISWDIMSHQ